MFITESQKDQMKHALGLGERKEPNRNYFYCDADDREWNDLVNKGLAKKRKGWDDESAYFHVTEEGIRFLSNIMNTD